MLETILKFLIIIAKFLGILLMIAGILIDDFSGKIKRSMIFNGFICYIIAEVFNIMF
jgi:hypothetical protein